MCDSGGVFTEKLLARCVLQNGTWNDWIPSSARAGAEDIKFCSGRGLCFLFTYPMSDVMHTLRSGGREMACQEEDWEVT